MASKNLVLRTMYIDPDVDNQLRIEAFDSRTSKNDLVRKYLRMGMEVAKENALREAALASNTDQQNDPGLANLRVVQSRDAYWSAVTAAAEIEAMKKKKASGE